MPHIMMPKGRGSDEEQRKYILGSCAQKTASCPQGTGGDCGVFFA
jgi:hypothetical protein